MAEDIEELLRSILRVVHANASSFASLRNSVETIRESMAGLRSDVAELRRDVARIDTTTRETQEKVQYLWGISMGETDHKVFQAGGKR